MLQIQLPTKVVAALGFGFAMAYILVAVIAGGSARAASPVSVEVKPTTVTLPAGGTTTVVVLVSNPGSTAVKAKVRALVPNDALAVVPTGPAATRARGTAVPVRIRAEGAVALPFTVTRVSSASADSLEVQFLTRVAADRTVVASTLTVKAPASTAILSLEFKPGLEKLNEYRPDETSLVVSNARDEPVELTTMQIRAPRDVTITAKCEKGDVTITDGEMASVGKCGSKLLPRGQLVIPLQVKASSYLAPGSRTILVQASARTREADAASVVLGEDFTVDIYGESEILKALAVPIFLLLPGAIIIVVAPLLVRHLSPWHRSPAPALTLGSATIMVIASVAISLAFGLLYPRMTDLWPGEPRDYRRAQGFEDFYWVFAWALLVAIGLWLLSLLVFVAWRLVWQHNFSFTAQDEPGDLLRKVARRTWFLGAVQFPLVNVTQGTDTLNGLKLPKPVAKDKTYIGPRVAFQLPDESSWRDEHRRVRRAMDAYLRSTARGSGLGRRWRLRRLRRSLARASTTLSFLPGDVAGLGDRDASSVHDQPGPRRSVVVETGS